VGLGAASHLPDETARVYGHAKLGREDLNAASARRLQSAVRDRRTMSEETKPDAGAAKEAAAKNRDEVALELMKFIAVTTGYGKGNTTAAGFSGKPAKSSEEYADALIQLFEKCRSVVAKPAVE